MIMSNRLSSWQYKLYFVAVTPIIFSILIIFIALHSLSEQNSELKITSDNIQLRQHSAVEFLAANLKLQGNIKYLIAVDDLAQIHNRAIATIKSSAILDEQLQRLYKAMPGDIDISTMQALYIKVKQKTIKIIGEAKRNNDREAIDILLNLEPIIKELDELAKIKVENELSALNLLEKNNNLKNKKLSIYLIGILLFGSIISIVICLFIGRLLRVKVTQVDKIVSSFKNGYLNSHAMVHGNDEISKMAGSICATIKNTSENVKKIVLETTTLKESNNVVSQSIVNFSKNISALENTYKNIDTSTQQIVSLSSDISGSLSVAKEKSTIACSQVSSALDKCSINFTHLEDVENSISESSENTKKMRDTVDTITSISVNISEISNQTNLLALNAAIEAARAGESGRGFAVVADEVRNLAQRSNDAVDEIANLATALTGSVQKTMENMDITCQKINTHRIEFKNTLLDIENANQIISQAGDYVVSANEIGHQQKNEAKKIMEKSQCLKDVIVNTSEATVLIEGVSQSLTSSTGRMHQLVNHYKV